ncbi:MAG: DUF1653 domain-containing protein [Solirubrobacteraceae bacterium]
MPGSTNAAVVVGRGRHSETESVYELMVRDDTLHAEPAERDDRPTWLSERWEDLVSESALAGPWVHYKNAVYTVYGEARVYANEGLVVYTGSDGRVWLRPAEMWEEHVSVGSYAGPRFRRRDDQTSAPSRLPD